MMTNRPIHVSTDVFAAIWADRKQGEDTEEQILRRKFGVQEAAQSIDPAAMKRIGFSDPRFGIELEEGFEIFRVYQGTEYRAKAVNGTWLLMSTGEAYPSLNQLSRAIGTRGENAWQNWYFTGSDGKRHLVTALRRKS